MVHQDSLKPFEGTGHFSEDDVITERNAPLTSPSDKDAVARDTILDDVADLFMPHSAQLSDIPCAPEIDPSGAVSSSGSDSEEPPPQPRRRNLRPRGRLRKPERYSPA